MQQTQITLPRFDDLHAHFRVGETLSLVLPYTVAYAGRAIAMPNTRPRAVLCDDDVTWYGDQIARVVDALSPRPDFTPLMTIEIRDNTTPAMVEAAHRAGAVAGKVYPLGVTHNSEEGLRSFESAGIQDTFRAMRDRGMLLLLHGEIDLPRTLVTKREEVFLPILRKLVDAIPDLKIVLEHVSTKAAVNMVRDQLPDTVAATITAHHLCLTLNDVVGYGIEPHNGCMPMPKDFPDRDALIEAATGGNQKFFLGSDTAPHAREKKECRRGACGVFSAPVLPEVLAGVFESCGRLAMLEGFTSQHGAAFYGLPPNQGTITLVKQDWTVPDMIGNIVPFKSGETLHWKLVS